MASMYQELTERTVGTYRMASVTIRNCIHPMAVASLPDQQHQDGSDALVLLRMTNGKTIPNKGLRRMERMPRQGRIILTTPAGLTRTMSKAGVTNRGRWIISSMPTHTRASPQSGPKAVNTAEKEESNKDLIITITPMKLQVGGGCGGGVGVGGRVAQQQRGEPKNRG